VAVYDRVDKRRRRAINASKKFKQSLIGSWKTGTLPKTIIIKWMAGILILDIKVWWLTLRLKKSGYYDRD